ncbi:hypothetical protein [Streptosporangium vulgare]|uniref:hypothetical protein n=1 Tax=Streptosporangium vulgare TaxID=46190 RepID=UPI0031D3A1A8
MLVVPRPGLHLTGAATVPAVPAPEVPPAFTAETVSATPARAAAPASTRATAGGAAIAASTSTVTSIRPITKRPQNDPEQTVPERNGPHAETPPE